MGLGYFAACRAEKALLEFRDLMAEFWAARKEHRDLEKFARLREQIAMRITEVQEYTERLGLGTVLHSFPAPAFAGSAPVVTLNIFECVLDPDRGHEPVDNLLIFDFVNTAIGAAHTAKRRGLVRLLSPWYWVIDLTGFVLRVPFLILRQAGLPATVEENFAAMIIKVLEFALIVWVALRFGLRLSLDDLLGLVK